MKSGRNYDLALLLLRLAFGGLMVGLWGNCKFLQLKLKTDEQLYVTKPNFYALLVNKNGIDALFDQQRWDIKTGI